MNGDGVECIYVAEVSDQSWTNTRTLLFFAPAQSAQGMCGLNRPPNSMAPQIRPRFLGLVASCALLLFTAVQFPGLSLARRLFVSRSANAMDFLFSFS